MAVQLEMTGKVALQNGLAGIELAPVRADVLPPPPPAPRPTLVEIQAWPVHASRLPLTLKVAQSAMVTVQKQLGLRSGLAGDWTGAATDRLRSNLAKAKRGAATLLALENGFPTKKQKVREASSSSIEAAIAQEGGAEENPEAACKHEDIEAPSCRQL